MFERNWKKEIFTVPNLLSLFRLLLIPVYTIIYLEASEAKHFIWAACILALSCLTDWFDGKVARHFGQITTLGKVLDPLADKATQFTLIFCLTVRYPVLKYLLILFAAKECFQLIAGTFALKKGKMLDGALFAGKICTVVLFVSLILLILFPNLSELFVTSIVLLDGLFLLFSLLTYFTAYFGKANKLKTIFPN